MQQLVIIAIIHSMSQEAMANKEFNEIQILREGMLHAGKIAMDYWQKGVKAEIKTANYDVTSEADLKVEEYLIAYFKEHFPDLSVLGEESGGKISNNGFTVDGVDGSSFFASGLPEWAISLSKIQNGVVYLSMIFSPVLNEFYWAKRGLGAYLNGQRIHVSSEDHLQNAIVNLGQDIVRINNRFDIEQSFIQASRAHFVTASSALAYGRLAAGKLHVAVHMGQPVWDIAPGIVLIEEASGKFTNWNGTRDFVLDGKKVNNIVASNGILHQQAIMLLN